MKVKCSESKAPERALALLLVLVFMGISFLLMGSILLWTSTNSNLNDRNNRYHKTVAAAEAASEKVLAHISGDFQREGEVAVYNTCVAGTYRSKTPTTGENPEWSRYEFNNTVSLDMNARTNYIVLNSKYAGLRGVTDNLSLKSYATDGPSGISVGIRQDIQLATVPLFQFAIIYNFDLEIENNQDMDVTGPVHSNGDTYLYPGKDRTLTFWSSVTTHGQFYTNRMYKDDADDWQGKIVYKDTHSPTAGKSQLMLPVGTNASPETASEILNIPPPIDDTQMSKERYYNKADIVIVVSDPKLATDPPVITATSGNYNLFSTTIPTGGFLTISTNSFYDAREKGKVNAINLDVDKFGLWANDPANQLNKGGLSRVPNSIYIADLRKTSVPSGTKPGIRLFNGNTANFPSAGLTVATPAPLYVQGNFNAPTPGSADTSKTKPASLVADAVTVLSTLWKDSENQSLSTIPKLGRPAGDTTVNAALLTGIVKTTMVGTNYYRSGGCENFTRFLEFWTDKTFTYNGSMVGLFYSKVATNIFRAGEYYKPPTRKWAFDQNFRDPNKLPPCSPQVRMMIRSKWELLASGD